MTEVEWIGVRKPDANVRVADALWDGGCDNAGSSVAEIPLDPAEYQPGQHQVKWRPDRRLCPLVDRYFNVWARSQRYNSASA
jgi:hypothetical protein